MPSATEAQRHKLNADPVRDAHVLLLEFIEDTRSTYIRVCHNNEDITHDSNVFTGINLQAYLPSSTDKDQSISITVSNIQRGIGAALMRAKNLVGCRMIWVDASIPDTAIIDTKNQFVIRNAKVTGEIVTLTLGPRVSTREPFPFQRTGKDFLPGVWLNR